MEYMQSDKNFPMRLLTSRECFLGEFQKNESIDSSSRIWMTRELISPGISKGSVTFLL